jgi:hypothetical protein
MTPEPDTTRGVPDATPLFHLPAGWKPLPAREPEARGAAGRPARPQDRPAPCRLGRRPSSRTPRDRHDPVIWITISDRSPAMPRGLALGVLGRRGESGDRGSAGNSLPLPGEMRPSRTPGSTRRRAPFAFTDALPSRLPPDSDQRVETALRAFYYDGLHAGDAHGEETGYLHAWRRECARQREDHHPAAVEGRGRSRAVRIYDCELELVRSHQGRGRSGVFLTATRRILPCAAPARDYTARLHLGAIQRPLARLPAGGPRADALRLLPARF